MDLERGKGNRMRLTKKIIEAPRPDGPIQPGSPLDGGCEVVPLHGDLHDLRCTLCNGLCSWDEEGREQTLMNGESPECDSCLTKDDRRRSRGKRGTAVGTLRPNLVLYGEEHPSADILGPITTHDLGLNPDILLIMGTSLRVHGLKLMIREFAKAVHARTGSKGHVIFVNQTKPADSVWSGVIDYWVGMDCDDWVADLHSRRSDLWERQGVLKLPVSKKKSGKQIKESDAPSGDDKENPKKRCNKRKSVGSEGLDVSEKAKAGTDATKKGPGRPRGRPPLKASKPASTVCNSPERQLKRPRYLEDRALQTPSRRHLKVSSWKSFTPTSIGTLPTLTRPSFDSFGTFDGGDETLPSLDWSPKSFGSLRTFSPSRMSRRHQNLDNIERGPPSSPIKKNRKRDFTVWTATDEDDDTIVCQSSPKFHIEVLKRNHTESNESRSQADVIRTLKCEHCDKTFEKPGPLKKHMYIHNLSRPFRCSIPDCSTRVARRDMLQRHFRERHTMTLEEAKAHAAAVVPCEETERDMQASKDGAVQTEPHLETVTPVEAAKYHPLSFATRWTSFTGLPGISMRSILS
jgi:Sir2 family/Zinc finger, C2H2 type